MAENNTWSEEQPRYMEESSREDSVDLEEGTNEAQRAEEERIARAIKGEGEFLSEELKGLIKEVELVHRLRAGVLAEEIEASLKGVMEPSIEKLKEAIRIEIRMVEAKFLVDILNRRGKRIAEKQAPSMDEAYKKSAGETPGKLKEGAEKDR